MSIKRSAAQILDRDVADWEASSRPQSFRITDGRYVCDLQSGGLGTYGKGNDVKVTATLLFIASEPNEGQQVRLTRFLSTTNQSGENYGVGQLLDEIDAVRSHMGENPVDRAALKKGKTKALEALIAELVESRPKDIPIVVKTTEPNDKGKTFQNMNVELTGTMEDSEGTEPGGGNLAVGKTVSYEGKDWTITEIDEDIVTIKSGRRVKSVSSDQLS